MALRNKVLAYIVLIPAWLVMSLPVCADAVIVDHVALDDSVVVGTKTLVLNGAGTRKATIFGIRVYVMGLYLETPSTDPQEIIDSRGDKRIVMHFVRAVDASRLNKGWQEGFQKNYRHYTSLREEITAFQAAMRDVQEGDRIILDFVDDRVDVAFGSTKAARIAGENFQQALLSVWLGPEPPNAALKEGLLGR